MREIKFKVYDKTEKKIFKLDTAHDTFNFYDGMASYYNLQNGSGGDEYVLLQNIGIPDRHGVDIYEGDILGIQYENGNDLYVVEWGDMGFLIIRVQRRRNGKTSECNIIMQNRGAIQDYSDIIGNIYEHPTLIEDMK